MTKPFTDVVPRGGNAGGAGLSGLYGDARRPDRKYFGDLWSIPNPAKAQP
eukprot:gene30390-37598_t